MTIFKRTTTAVALLLLFFALWPHASSLYDLTGEEAPAAQLRGVIHWLNTAVRLQPDYAPTAVAPSVNISLLGMNTFLQQEVEPAKREQSLQMIQEAGFTFIRQEFTWEDIEIHGKGDFEDRRNMDAVGAISAWAKYDNIVELAEQHHLQILARLSNPPSWSNALPEAEIGTHGPPDNIRDYGDFAQAVAERYKGRIHFYQLWNEPNIYPEWGERNVDPEAYAALLCEGYRRIKAVDPTAVILLAALSPTVAMDGRNMNDLIFLQRLYDSGASDCFDVLSTQGYGLWSGPSDQRLRPTVINYGHHLFLRDLMVRNGDAAKPLWISEMGWNSVPAELPANYGRVTEEQRARYAVQAYQRAQSEWPWVQGMAYWFFKRPADTEKDQSWYYFRALEPDFTPWPVFTALAEYGRSPQNPPPLPLWVYSWMQLRPWLFKIGASILFFQLCAGLAPKKDAT